MTTVARLALLGACVLVMGPLGAVLALTSAATSPTPPRFTMPMAIECARRSVGPRSYERYVLASRGRSLYTYRKHSGYGYGPYLLHLTSYDLVSQTLASHAHMHCKASGTP